MKFGVTIRNMGVQSTPDILQRGTQYAESLGFESIWITDHIAIPPDDAEGSGGRYTDPLTTLAYLAGCTTKINVGVGVLILPYRPALPTAKQIATIQELSDGRLLLGAGVGWMDAEFRALGLDRHQRGKLTDATLATFADCFDNHVVEQNGQDFIFSPRPVAPPIYIGGSAPHALKRAIRYGHGWMPMTRHPEGIREAMDMFTKMASEAGARRGPVTAMSGLPEDKSEAEAALAGYEALGVERLVLSVRYDTLDEYKQRLESLGERLATG